MNFKEIQKHIKKKDYLFSEHADEERTKDQLTASRRVGWWYNEKEVKYE